MVLRLKSWLNTRAPPSTTLEHWPPQCFTPPSLLAMLILHKVWGQGESGAHTKELLRRSIGYDTRCSRNPHKPDSGEKRHLLEKRYPKLNSSHKVTAQQTQAALSGGHVPGWFEEENGSINPLGDLTHQATSFEKPRLCLRMAARFDLILTSCRFTGQRWKIDSFLNHK